jgi:gamma-glutamylcyclotransferase (GGCT)/AIG2-like uncharacterized protein YtfP
MTLFFAYGSNMDPNRMAGRAPSARVVGPARLDGFRLAFSVFSTKWEGGAANLELDDHGRVWGVVWDVPDSEVHGLDAFHGHPTYFRREDVVVELGEEPVIAWTYRVAHQTGSYVRPTDAYLNMMRAAIRLQGLPPEALDLLDEAARPKGRPSIST